jgi:predicted AAA+ superfamily ATPase
MFRRMLNPIASQSFFVFGPRGTGKSTFLKEYFAKTKSVLWIDLLDFAKEQHYRKYPQELKNEILAASKPYSWVVVDEVQRCPKLLDVVHQLIESTHTRFVLTGSSARKLKRGAANLLAGRVFMNQMHPLTFLELRDFYSIESLLSFGSLPRVFQLKTKAEKNAFLQSYALTFLKEEIKEEQIVRNLDPFSRFLEVAAQANGEIVNYLNISRDVGVSGNTVQTYFQILEDTLMGFFLPAFHLSIRKQQSQSPKFYFFDLGICRALQEVLDQKIIPKTYGFGRYFECHVILEFFRVNSYLRKGFRFSYLRTKDQAEIDLIVSKPNKPQVILEIKSTNQIHENDAHTLKRFVNDFGPKTRAYILSLDPIPKAFGKIMALPWAEGIAKILNISKQHL